MSSLRLFAASALVLLAASSASAAGLVKRAAGTQAHHLPPSLDMPMSHAMDALDDLHQQVQQAAKGSSVEALVRRVEADKRALKADLRHMRSATTGKDEAAVRDAAVVAMAQGLRAAELVSEGLLNGNNGQAVTGVRLAGLAYGTLKRLRESAPATAGAGSSASGAPNAIGRAAGLNVSLQGQNDSTAFDLGLNISFPATRALDYGFGTTLNTNFSSTSGGGSSDSLTWGLNAFTRYHFLGLFPSAGWANIVPYVGLQIGLNTNFGSQTSGGSISTSSGDTFVLGGLLGALFFLTPQSALSMQLELADNVGSSSSAGTTTSQSYASELLTFGLNEMF